MNRLLLATLVCLVTASGALAASCKDTAAEKNLHGAALNSFMKKCTTDATTACNTQATEKKLAGAAKTSFTKKCVTDATGS